MSKDMIRIGFITILAIILLSMGQVVYADDSDKDKTDNSIDIDINGKTKVDISISGPATATIGAKGTSEVNIDVDDQVDLSIDADETSSVTIYGQNSIQGNSSIQPSASQSMEAQYNDPSQDVDNNATDSYRNTSEFQRLLIIITITIVITGLIAFFAIRHYIKNNHVARLKGETKEEK